ncbi:MAG: hypothetical protein K1000chlam1_00794 [Candidatus Anoxychlamydiales bacterium]|nr:hypothetical protein [Candidatus Anoxychlamydiales bacterium]
MVLLKNLCIRIKKAVNLRLFFYLNFDPIFSFKSYPAGNGTGVGHGALNDEPKRK